ERRARVEAPVVVKHEMDVGIDCVLQCEPIRIPRVPEVAVDVETVVQPCRVQKGERAPVTPALPICPAQITDIVDFVARRLALITGLEASNAAAVLSDQQFLRVSSQRRET